MLKALENDCQKRRKTMLYAERDNDGNIISLTSIKGSKAADVKSAVDDEVIEFLNKNDDASYLRLLLNLSDSGVIRTLEDLINLLIDKKVIQFTELPEEAQKRIRERQKLRQKLFSNDLMVDDIL